MSIFLFLILILFFLGFYTYLKPVENGCAMTYMFQYPEFIRITMDSRVRKRFPSYNLYAYGEGAHAASLSSGSFTGTPVLFVPGNAGSYAQVRSMASIAYRMYQENMKRYQLDFFTIDYNEEKAALFGQLLTDQVLFLAESVTRIQQLYAPQTVHCILVGHSIGGVVARGLLLEPSFNPSCIDLLVTLSAPHDKPVVSVDDTMTNFYERVNQLWKKERTITGNSSRLSHLNHVSISGGFHDVLVRAELSRVDGDYDKELRNTSLDVNLVTTSIPDVWLSIDHQCIVWCKQFAIKMARVIYDVVEFGSLNSEKKRNILSYHLATRTRGKFYPNHAIPNIIVYPSTGEWVELTERIEQYTTGKGKILEPLYLLIKLVPKTTFFLLVDGEVRHDWISGCNITDSRTSKITGKEMPACGEGVNFYSLTKVALGTREGIPRRYFRVSADLLISRGITHANVGLTPTTSSLSLVTERFSQGKRNTAVVLPSIIQLLTMLFSYVPILNVPIGHDSSYYNISLVGLEQVWHAFNVRIHTTTCYPKASESSLGHFHVPWNREDVYTKIPNVKNYVTSLILKVNVPKMAGFEGRHPSLQLFLEPSCGFKLSIKLDFFEVLGQLIRFYYQYLIPLGLGILTSAFALQLTLVKKTTTTLEEEEDEVTQVARAFLGPTVTTFCHETSDKILRKRFAEVTMYGVLPILPYLMVVVVTLIPESIVDYIPLGKYAASLRMDNLTPVQYIILFLTLFLMSYSIVYVVTLVMQMIFRIISRLVILTAKKLRYVQMFQSIIPSLLSPPNPNLSLKPFVTAIMLVFISVATVSGVGFLLSFVIHVGQLIILSVKCIHQMDRRGFSRWSTNCFPHTTIAILLLLSTMSSFPLVMYWSSIGHPFFMFFPLLHSRAAYIGDKSDVHVVPALISILSMSIIWQQSPLGTVEGTTERKYVRHVFKYGISALAIILTVTGHNIQVIPYVISGILLVIAWSVIVGDASPFLPGSGTTEIPNSNHEHQD